MSGRLGDDPFNRPEAGLVEEDEKTDLSGCGYRARNTYTLRW